MGLRKLVQRDYWPNVSRRGPDRYRAFLGRDMRNYWEQVRANYAGRVNAFGYYTALVDGLRALPDASIRPLCELPRPGEAPSRTICLRHDIDADPLTALRAARYLARFGICGSFYLLHSAPYYGDFQGPVFVRNPQLLEWIDGFLAAGCELGLHNDALGIQKFFNADGAAALVSELQWLRGQGVGVQGTVSHNSFPAYSAENFEVFRGRVLWRSGAFRSERTRYPLGSLVESELSLRYEGTFARPKRELDGDRIRRVAQDLPTDVRSPEWMKTYLVDNPFFDWDLDFQAWLVGVDQWVVGGEFDGDREFRFGIPLDELFGWLLRLPSGSRTVLVVHPAYVRD